MARVQWTEGRTVTAVTTGTGYPVLLAHGAGAGRSHPFMVGVAGRLAGNGFAVTTFDYPYMEEGRRAPDRLPTLLAAHRAVYDTIGDDAAPFLVGKSMGGRVGSHLDVATPGRVFLGYPLVALGKTDPRDTNHLAGEMLFIQGERDRLAPLEAITAVVRSRPGAELVVIPEADHSFRVPKRTGLSPETMLDLLVVTMMPWLRFRSGAAG